MSVSLQPHGPQPAGRLCPGTLLVETLERVALPFQGAFPTRDRVCGSHVPCVGRWVLYHWPHLGSRFSLTASVRWGDGMTDSLRPLSLYMWWCHVPSRSPDLPNLTSADFSVVGACDNWRKDGVSPHRQPPQRRPGRAHSLGASPQCAGGSLPRGSLLSPSFTAKPLILFFISFFYKTQLHFSRVYYRVQFYISFYWNFCTLLRANIRLTGLGVVGWIGKPLRGLPMYLCLCQVFRHPALLEGCMSMWVPGWK